MAQCQVCGHRRLREINTALAAPRPNAAAVARTFGADEQATRRHLRNGHVPVAETPAPGATEPLGDVDPVAMLRDRLEAMRRSDPAALSPREAREQMEAIRRAADTLSKVAPAAPAERALSWDELMASRVGDGPRTVGDYFAVARDVLEPHPEVREKLAAGFKRLEVR